MTPDEIKKYMLSLQYDDFTTEFIEGKFCNHYDPEKKKMVPPEISFQAEFTLKKGEYLNDKDTKTNVGQMVVNKILFGNTPGIQKVLGYVAAPFNKKLIEQNEDRIAKALAFGEIQSDDYARYLDNIQWLGNTFNTHVACSFTPNTCKPLPSVNKKKKELYEKHKDEIAKGNAVKDNEITDELLKMAKDELKNDVGMTIYDSGCKPKFGNSYKAMYVSRGAVFNASEERYDISTSCFMDGIRREDVPIGANSVVNGSYPKAVGTKDAGYETKKLFSCYQSVHLGKKGSDCGTKLYRSIKVTEKNKTGLINRYYSTGTKTELITPQNINGLVGKIIKVRSPLYCGGGIELCNKCIGETPYVLGIENVGITAGDIGGNLLNIFMKAFHDLTIKTYTIDPKKMIIE